MGAVFGLDWQRPVTLGLPEGVQLLGQLVTAAGTQERRQASAQALRGLFPGVILEKLAHGVPGEVVLEKGGRQHVPQVAGCCCPAQPPKAGQGLTGSTVEEADTSLSDLAGVAQ